MAYYSGVLALAEFVTLSIVLAILWTLLALAFCMSTATRIKSGQFWKHTLWHYIAAFFRKWLIDPIRRLHRAIHENTKLSTRLGLGLVHFSLGGTDGLTGNRYLWRRRFSFSFYIR